MQAGFVYVATGSKYVKEAEASLKSLRLHNPDVRVCLCTDQKVEVEGFDDFVWIENAAYDFSDKFHMIRAPYERAIFLDTDTLITGPLQELFEVLDTHDIAARPEVSPGLDYTLPGLPSTFPELTTGVIVYRKRPNVEAFFESWRAKYAELLTISDRFVPDQPSFRAALYSSDLRHCAIPPEYHLQADFGAYVYWKVNLVHCHEDQERRAAEANVFYGPRAWHPLFGAIPTSYTGLKNHLFWWARLNRRFARVAWSALRGRI